MKEEKKYSCTYTFPSFTAAVIQMAPCDHARCVYEEDSLSCFCRVLQSSMRGQGPDSLQTSTSMTWHLVLTRAVQLPARTKGKERRNQLMASLSSSEADTQLPYPRSQAHSLTAACAIKNLPVWCRVVIFLLSYPTAPSLKQNTNIFTCFS